jgi:hypothetical protein
VISDDVQQGLSLQQCGAWQLHNKGSQVSVLNGHHTYGSHQ